MLRIGSLGAGGRGILSKLAHRPQEGVELTAICDLEPKVHEAYRQTVRPDIAVYTDYRKLLDEAGVDAVFITTPDFLHEEMAVAALQRGIGVYLEKPMAITIEGCDRILNAAEEHKAKLYVGHNMRFFPVIQKMKEIIDSGRIGPVQAIWCRHFVGYGGDAFFKDWHSERKNSTGLLLQKAAHDIDVIHYLAGAHSTRVTGMGRLSVYNQIADRCRPGERGNADRRNSHWPPLTQKQLSPVIDIEDHSMMFMQLANGVQASYTQCHYTPDSHRNYTVIGTQGRIENCGDGGWAIIRIWDYPVSYLENGTEAVCVLPIAGTHDGADPIIVNDFIEYLKTGRCVGADPLDARAAVAAGYLATQSLRQHNQPYDVPKYRPTGAVSSAGTQPAKDLASKEAIEWCDVWISHANESALPRVLLLGDSIARNYYQGVEQKLAGQAYVSRLCTSAFLTDPMLYRQIAMVLEAYQFAVIHFNNGLHGWQHSEAKYKEAFPQFLATLKAHAPQAKLIWANSTSLKASPKLPADKQTQATDERIAARNAIALEYVKAARITVNDLHALTYGKAELYTDNCHFNDKGIALQADQVAACIRKVMHS